MSAGRHSYVPFYPSDWIAGTARMTPMQELIYFRVCCYIWDKAEPVPDGELPLMLGNIDGWQETIELFIQSGKLDRSPNGITNKRALGVSQESLRLWKKKSGGGKIGAAKRWEGKIKPKKTNKKEADRTPNSSPNGSGMGVPMHNHNHNQTKESLPNGRGRATRLPDDWTLPSNFETWALEEGWPADRVALEADKFHDYWISASGQKATKRNWLATWRNWMRNIPKAKSNGISPEAESERSKKRVARALEILEQRGQ